jgi:LemA protein
MDLIYWAIIGIVALLVVIFIVIYNSLIMKRNRVDNSWAQIDVQTKLRYDLIPNLVETVKGYAKHEKAVFTEVTEARAAITKAASPREHAKAQNMLTDALKSLFAVAENYPQLRASENFQSLQGQLSEVEAKIAYARQFYNDSVLSFNASLQTFPTSIIAGMFHFTEREYYEPEPESRKAVKVKF